MASGIARSSAKTVELILRRPQSCSQPLSVVRTIAAGGGEVLRRPQNHKPIILKVEELHTTSTNEQSSQGRKFGVASSSPSKVHFSRVAYDTSVATDNEIDASVSANWIFLKEETFEHKRTTGNIILFADDAIIFSPKRDIQEIKIINGCNGQTSSLPPDTSIPSSIRGAARMPDGRLVVCGRKELIFYDAVNCEYESHSKLLSGSPNTMTVDKNGNILLGMMDTRTIAIYNANGTFQRLFHTDSSPRSLAVTSDGQLVTSFVDGTLQIMELRLQKDSSRESESARVIPPPPSMPHQFWQPTSICCSDNGDLFVVDWSQGAVHRYTSNGEYGECVCEGLRDPQEIAVSSNGEELYVLESGLSASPSIAGPSNGPCVKTFKLVK